jgi:hypothetical protein
MGRKAFDEEYRAAVQAAAMADATEPRAKSARYDRRRHRIIVELRNGASFLFPPEMAQGLAGASADDLANVHVSPSGAGLHWPSLDADFSVVGLMMGVFGNKAWMAELSRPGGRRTPNARGTTVIDEKRTSGRPQGSDPESAQPRRRVRRAM